MAWNKPSSGGGVPSGDVPFSSVTGKPTTLSGYGITDALATSRAVNTSSGLTGGGTLAADRTITIAPNGVTLSHLASDVTSAISSGTTSIWADKKVNFMGDSITREDGQINFRMWLQSMLGFSVGRNYGENATEIAGGETSCMANRVQTMDADADLIFVLGGTNDFGHNIPMGVNHTIDGTTGALVTNADINTFYGGLHLMCQRLIARYPNKAIVILTPLHRFDILDFRDDQRNTQGNYLYEYVNAVKEVAAWYSLPVCDLWGTALMAPSQTAYQQYFFDNLHPNSAGHRLIADTIAGFVNSRFATRFLSVSAQPG